MSIEQSIHDINTYNFLPGSQVPVRLKIDSNGRPLAFFPYVSDESDVLSREQVHGYTIAPDGSHEVVACTGAAEQRITYQSDRSGITAFAKWELMTPLYSNPNTAPYEYAQVLCKKSWDLSCDDQYTDGLVVIPVIGGRHSLVLPTDEAQYVSVGKDQGESGISLTNYNVGEWFVISDALHARVDYIPEKGDNHLYLYHHMIKQPQCIKITSASPGKEFLQNLEDGKAFEWRPGVINARFENHFGFSCRRFDKEMLEK